MIDQKRLQLFAFLSHLVKQQQQGTRYYVVTEKIENWRVLAKTGHNALRTISQHGERVGGGLDGDLYESALSQGQREL